MERREPVTESDKILARETTRSDLDQLCNLIDESTIDVRHR